MHPYYITTPIYYVNANPHLGHAYTTIVADAASRYHKMLGEKTLFLTGTDEHGDKIVQAAEKKNMSPEQFVNEISSHFRTLWPRLAAQPDRIMRTTDGGHIRAVQKFLQIIYDKGDIYFGEFGGFYCYGCERFYTEKELQDGLCPQHLSKPQFISEKNYFFRMSRYLPWLQEYIHNHPDLIRPERYRREALAMLEDGVLEDLCISRPKTRLTWGIELPFDPNYVCYVWFDALVSYISDIGWPDGPDFKTYWPGEHLIAKDILKPHAIFWPCMLKAADLPVYRHLDVHGYWLSRETKMSKSLGNVIEPLQTAQHYGLDAFRYFLLRDMRFGQDASFSEEAITTRINADLANDLGNLFSRVLSMCAKYFVSRAPADWKLEPADHAIAHASGHALANFMQLFANMEFALGIESLLELARTLNKYVDEQAPWSLFKTDNLVRLGTVMNVLLAALRKLAICFWPVMPDASQTMLAQLGEKELAQKAAAGQAPIASLEEEAKNFAPLAAGQKLAQASNLFPRMEKKTNMKQEEQPHKAEKAAIKYVGIDNFNVLDIRAGKIVRAEKHPNADRILRLEIDFGEAEPRQILSGLAEFYKPEELEGRMICAIVNLEPRKIRGLVSNGMVLTASDDNGLSLLDPGQTRLPGSRIS